MLDGSTLIHRPRPKPSMQLPTVCVSSLADPLQHQQQFATTTLNLLAAATTTQTDSPLVSPVFVDTTTSVSSFEREFVKKTIKF